MIVKKITVGFVIQEFDTDLGKFTSQEFVASDEVEIENSDGETLEDIELPYLSFDMVQPE